MDSYGFEIVQVCSIWNSTSHEKSLFHIAILQKKEGDRTGGYKVYLGLNGSDVNRIIKAKPNIAVIDFAEFGDAQIKKLRSKGIKLISYLNVGAIEKNRSYYSKYKKHAIGTYADWDEKWMDLSKKEWQEFLIGQK